MPFPIPAQVLQASIAAFLFLSASSAPAADPAGRPNVVLILADDMYEIRPGEVFRSPCSPENPAFSQMESGSRP